MWYFTWVLGISLACSFAIINALWHESRENPAADKSTDD